jgi:putative FmdB family regulatory protein
MVKYDYKCAVCDNDFEVEKSYTSKKKVKCTKCKSPKVRKVIGVIPVIFKGSDFTLSKTKSE